MSLPAGWTPNPALDLVLERLIDLTPAQVWAAWTTPEHVMKWFTPAPWTVAACEIDLRAGGIFSTDMRAPDGQIFPNIGVILEVVPNERLIFTDTLQPGYRPSDNPFMTAIIAVTPAGSGSKYTAIAMHRDEATRIKHEEMGFHSGWGLALDQMITHMQKQ